MLDLTESPGRSDTTGSVRAWRAAIADGPVLRFESTLTQVFLRTSCCGGQFSYADEFLGSIPGPVGFLCCRRCRKRTLVPEEMVVASWNVENLLHWLEPLLDAVGIEPLQQVLIAGELADHFKSVTSG